MRIAEIYKQKEGKWIDYTEFTILDVGEPQETEHGLAQTLKIADEIGTRAEMTCYVQEGCEDFLVEPDYEGKLCSFAIRHKEGRLIGHITNECPPETYKRIDWEVINFGKCRHGILVAMIGAGADPRKIEADVECQKTINNLAHFSMYGITQD